MLLSNCIDDQRKVSIVPFHHSFSLQTLWPPLARINWSFCNRISARHSPTRLLHLPFLSFTNNFFSWFITHRSRLCRLLHRLPHHLPVLLFIFSLGSWRFFRFFAFLDVSLPQKTVFSISRLLIQKFDVQSKFWTPTFSRFVVHAFATWGRLFEPVC